ncbi:dihydroorotate dehydrogenase [Bacteroides sp. CAG:1060]|nr:dihydroorotate dehydrogenase [Bacteroides sp. CAG:1060]
MVAAGAGGFSGRAIFPIAVRMVNQVSKACSIPIMGCGGVASAEDVIEMMMAGANAVQIGAENIRNPFVCKEIVEALPSLMDSLGITCLSEITGIV